MKPRCRQITPHEWLCHHGDATGFGPTPEAAYVDMQADDAVGANAAVSLDAETSFESYLDEEGVLEEVDALATAADLPWGHYIGNTFIELPKIPLIAAGFEAPPFRVTRPDGRELRVVAKGAR